MNALIRTALAVSLAVGTAGIVQAATTKETVKVLNELLERTKDGQEGYKLAAEKVQDPALKSLLSRYSQQREEFVDDLQKHVGKRGTQPEESASATGGVHRGWINLKAAVTKGDDAILAEVVRGEEAAVAAYDNTLKEQLPEDVRHVVQSQRNEIQDSLTAIRERLNGLNEGKS